MSRDSSFLNEKNGRGHMLYVKHYMEPYSPCFFFLVFFFLQLTCVDESSDNVTNLSPRDLRCLNPHYFNYMLLLVMVSNTKTINSRKSLSYNVFIQIKLTKIVADS